MHINREIQEQPEVIARLLSSESDNIKHIVAAIHDFNPAFVMIAARGTSDNAARYAQYILSIHAQMPVALATPSVHTLYGAMPNMSRALVIGISQSGQGQDVLRVLTDAKSQGALTLSITNDTESPLAQSAHYHIDLHAGPELSVAATKTYTAELMACAMLVAHWVDSADMLAELEQVPAYVRSALESSIQIQDWVQRYRYIERIAVIGRGYNYGNTFEISLKLKELCYIVGEEYSEADFRHGPIAMIQSGFPVIALAPSGKTQPLMRDLLEQLQKLGAECLVISDDPSLNLLSHTLMMIPQTPEWLSPIPAVVPGQVFAKHLALAKGHDVDKPVGLSKVTITT